MNPAPTMLSDYMTPALMWAVIATFTTGVVVYRATERLKKAWRAKSAQLDKVLKEGPPPRECQITGCHQPGTHLFVVSNGYFYACTAHVAAVGDWVGPYDQDLDQSGDLAKWEKEMPA